MHPRNLAFGHWKGIAWTALGAIVASLLLAACGSSSNSSSPTRVETTAPRPTAGAAAVPNPQVALLRAQDLNGWEIQPISASPSQCEGAPLDGARGSAGTNAISGLDVIYQRVAVFDGQATKEEAWKSMESAAYLGCFRRSSEEAIAAFGGGRITAPLKEVGHENIGSHARVLTFGTEIETPIGNVALTLAYLQCETDQVISALSLFYSNLQPPTHVAKLPGLLEKRAKLAEGM